MRLYFVETLSEDRRRLLCRWAEYLCEKGIRVRIAVDSTLAAQHLDQLLWTFSEESFVPHRFMPASELRETALRRREDTDEVREIRADIPDLEPVIISAGEAPPLDAEEAILCDGPVRIEYMEQFAFGVHFIMLNDQEQRQESRLLWQAARERGLQVQHVPQALSSPEKVL